MKINSTEQKMNWAKGSLNLAEKILVHDLVTQTLKYGGGDNAKELKIIKKKLENELGL